MRSNKNLNTGRFSIWLRSTQAALLSDSPADVPCGDCIACCCSSFFIHIKRDEKKTLQCIPVELVFPAPGLAKGDMVLGYDEQGKCPMLREAKCSIYAKRPGTCQRYDCRIYPATGIELVGDSSHLIAEQARRWRFEYPEVIDHELEHACHAAAQFLQEKGHLFPQGALPSNPTQLAVLAINVCDLFLEIDPSSSGFSSEEIARQITLKLT